MNEYNFKTYLPSIRRGTFPDDAVRVTKHSLTIAPNIMEGFGSVRYDTDKGEERVRLGFGIDLNQNAVQLIPTTKGYTVQCRQNGTGYINSSRLKFNLLIGDYLLDGDNIFRLVR